jgi:integrase
MARVDLTEQKVRALKPREQRYDVLDALVPGLRVHVTPNGSKSFMLKARYPGAKFSTRRAIGEMGAISLDQARTTAREWLGLIRNGVDPAAELAAQQQRAQAEQQLTFEVVAELYIKQKLAHARQRERSAQEIRKELIPVWGPRRINSFQRGDVIRLIDQIRDRMDRSAEARGQRATYAQARHVFTHIRAIFNFAAVRYDLDVVPTDRLKPRDLFGPLKPRERVLTDTELRALWRAGEKIGYPYGPLYQLLLLTGTRRDEARGARWREFDLKAGTWTIPAERYKQDSVHEVPLTEDALALLTQLPRFRHGDYVFSTSFGSAPVNGLSKSKARLDRLMRKELDGAELAPFVIHDMRRTVRTRLSELRIPNLIAEAVIGHSKRGLARIYDQHRYRTEKREALMAWQNKLRILINPPSEKVVQLARTGAAG